MTVVTQSIPYNHNNTAWKRIRYDIATCWPQFMSDGQTNGRLLRLLVWFISRARSNPASHNTRTTDGRMRAIATIQYSILSDTKLTAFHSDVIRRPKSHFHYFYFSFFFPKKSEIPKRSKHTHTPNMCRWLTKYVRVYKLPSFETHTSFVALAARKNSSC